MELFNVLTALAGNVTLDNEGNQILVDLRLNKNYYIDMTLDLFNSGKQPITFAAEGFVVNISYTKIRGCNCAQDNTKKIKPKSSSNKKVIPMINTEPKELIYPGTLGISVTQNIIGQSELLLLFDITRDNISIHWRKIITPSPMNMFNNDKMINRIILGSHKDFVINCATNQVSFATLCDNNDSPIYLLYEPNYSACFLSLITNPELFGKVVSGEKDIYKDDENYKFIRWNGDYVRSFEFITTETSTIKVENGDDKDDTTESI